MRREGIEAGVRKKGRREGREGRMERRKAEGEGR